MKRTTCRSRTISKPYARRSDRLQGLVVNAWCFLCLVTAVLSLLPAALAVDKVCTSGLYLARIWKETRDARAGWDAWWGRPSPAAARIGDAMTAGRT